MPIKSFNKKMILIITKKLCSGASTINDVRPFWIISYYPYYHAILVLGLHKMFDTKSPYNHDVSYRQSLTWKGLRHCFIRTRNVTPLTTFDYLEGFVTDMVKVSIDKFCLNL